MNENTKSKPSAMHVVAEGHSITSLRGTLHEGSPVTARDFAGGRQTFDELVKQKAIVERPSGAA